jgi:putative nucleotidyltransferase with HDIG domain
MTTVEQLLANANYDHSKYVSQISRIIAKKIGYSADKTEIITQAALFHDVGKSSVLPEILNKTGALTPQEYVAVKAHTEDGYRQIMEVIRILYAAEEAAKNHHERLDGSGYFGLSNGNICPLLRIISIADIYDALISSRAYKKSWDSESVIQYLVSHEHHFDRVIVGHLIDSIDEIMLLYKSKI